MKNLFRILSVITAVLLLSCCFAASAAAESEDTLPDFNQSNNGAQMAMLFFVAVGVLIVGALAALIVPIIVRSIKNHSSDSDGNTRRKYLPKNTMKRFWIVWGIIFVVLAIITAVGISVLYTALSEYESIQPGYEAEKVYNTYFKNINSSNVLEYVSFSVGEYETEADAQAYFRELIANNGTETDYHEVIADDAATHKYAVTVGDYTLGYFTIGQDEEKTTDKFGFVYPALQDAVIEIKPIYGVSVYAPENATVYVNGVAVSEECKIGDTVVLEDAEYFPDDDASYRNMINYSITGLYRTPSVEVTSDKSIALTLVYDETAEKYTTKVGDVQSTELKYKLDYDSEKSSYSAAENYIKLLASAYNEAYTAEVAAQEELKFETAYQTEVEKLLLEEAAEKTVLTDAENARLLTVELKALYEERVQYLGEKLNYFFYSKTTTDSKLAALKLIQPKSQYYTKVQSYYNWGSYTVKKFSYSGFYTDNYKWENEEHTIFSCEVHMSVDLYGYRYDKGAYVNWSEPWDVVMQVSLTTNKTGLIYHVAPIE